MQIPSEAETGVNQENLIGQVFLDWRCWSVPAGVNEAGRRSRRKDKPEKESGD